MRRSALRLCLSGLLSILLCSDLFGQREDEDVRSELVALTVGFSDRMFHDVDVNDARAIAKIWTQTLIKKLNKTVEDPGAKTLVFYDLPLIVRALQTGNVDLLILFPREHLEIRKQVPLEPILTGVAGETFTYEYVLLVRRDKGLGSLGQLRGKRLVVDTGGKGSISGMWLDTLLLKKGLLESRDLFGSIKEVNRTSQAVLSVFFRQADACLVPLQSFKTMVELNPQLGEELTVLIKSPGFCRGLVCARQEVYDKYRGLIQEGMFVLNTDPHGRQLLTIFRLSEVVPFQPVHLENVRKLVREYEALKAESGGKD